MRVWNKQTGTDNVSIVLGKNSQELRRGGVDANPLLPPAPVVRPRVK